MEFKPDQLTPACRLWNFREHLTEEGSMYWLYATKGIEIPDVKYNRGCYDMTKSRLHDVHMKALGYSAKIDPHTYNGQFLEKPEQQCMHHLFKIHSTPCEPREGFVYERLLDNTVEIRYFYCRTGIDFYMIKHRKINHFNEYMVIDIMLHVERMDFVEKFCDEYGIDFAELDILYNGSTPYITDVNNVAGQGMPALKFLYPMDFNLYEKYYTEQIKSL